MRRNKVFGDVGAPFSFGCEGECRIRLVAVMTEAVAGDPVATTGNPIAPYFFIFYCFFLRGRLSSVVVVNYSCEDLDGIVDG